MNYPAQQISLSGVIRLRNIADIVEQIRGCLRTSGSVVIDCRAVTEVDLALVQALVAAHKTAVARGQSLSLCGPGDGPLCRLLQAAGFLGTDGTPLTPEGQLWIGAGGKAA